MPLCAATVLSTSVALPTIPPDLNYQRVLISEDKNAGNEWQQAVGHVVRPEALAKEAMRFAWTIKPKPLTAGERTALEMWLESNRRALELMDASGRKGRLQWPQTRSDDSDPLLAPVKDLLQARLVQAAWLAERHDDAAAAEHLLRTLRLAELAADGEGALIHYLLGTALKSFSLQAIQKFALESTARALVVEKLLRGISAPNGEVEVYARALRVEFHDYVFEVANVVKVAEMWQGIAVKSPELLSFMVPDELLRAFCIFLTPSLVTQHPLPLDHQKEVAAAIPVFQLRLANARGPWKDRQPEPDPDESLKRFLKDAARILAKTKNEKLPLSKSATDRLRPAYNRFANPVGRLFEAMASPLGPSYDRVFRSRTEREATRLLLALRLFFLREQRWPDSLSELVGRGFLTEVPRDPFGEGVFHYSGARGLVWSVGPNGRDDGGKSAGGLRWEAPDAVWSLNGAPNE